MWKSLITLTKVKVCLNHKVDYNELRKESNMRKCRQHLCTDNFFKKFDQYVGRKMGQKLAGNNSMWTMEVLCVCVCVRKAMLKRVCFEQSVSRWRKVVDTQELVGNQKSKVLEELEKDYDLDLHQPGSKEPGSKAHVSMQEDEVVPA